MIINPELRRNIWLDFTFHRVILAPFVIILMSYLFYLTGGKGSSASIAFNLSILFIFLWGTKKASETVLEEVNNSTWDFQRQSTISPWSMTWGKLFGSTIYSWYGAFICLLIYCAIHTNTSAHLVGLQITSQEINLFNEIFYLVFGGLLGQAIALLLSLQLLPQIRREKNNKSFRYFLTGLLFGFLMTSYCFRSAKEVGQVISWHGYTFASDSFATSSLIIFLFWAIIGLQRSFCRELQYQNVPWVWAVFNLFCMIYFSGLVSFEKINSEILNISQLNDLQELFHQAPVYIAFFIAQTLTYIALFTDELTTIRYKHFMARLKEKNLLESSQQIPWWFISIIFTTIAGFKLIITGPQLTNIVENFSPSILILTTMLFLFRDVVLIHFFTFGKYPKKAMGAAFVYLFLLYFVFPLLLNALHFTSLLPLFWPSWGQNTALAIISAVVQIAIFAKLCQKRWQLKTQELDPSIKKA
ncbi:MAG: hypothetical protein HYX61_07475 [Gammaproteobacteria bacterium]|nr:hypothetical protein [Gammaproteobacteria bacterium]